MAREIGIIHSCAHALCTVLLVLRMIHKLHSCVGIGGKLFLRVVKFANSTRLAKFAKIKPPRNIWRIQYVECLTCLTQVLPNTNPLSNFSITY